MWPLTGFLAGRSSEWRMRWLIFAGVFALALGFALYTRHAWEDYYIVYRCSKNLAMGHGLVYTVGERVHAFTSPLGALIPAALNVLTGNTSDQLVLWLFRVLSAGLLAAAAVLLLDGARKHALGGLATAVVVGVFAVDAKTVDFSINGMEVGFMMFFLALALHALTVRSNWPILKLGLAGAGLMWTRPDGFIYLGSLGVGFLVFNAGRPIGQSRLGLLKMLAGAAALTTALYLPWLLWAWSYYGTPIPHPVIAKGYAFNLIAPRHLGSGLVNGLCFPLRLLWGDTAAAATFLPAYARELGGWPWIAVFCCKCLACACALYWCVPSARPPARASSFAFMLGLYYLSDIAPYLAPWYLPNCAILAACVCGHIVQHGLDVAGRRRWRFAKVPVGALAAAVLAAALLLTVCVAHQMRVQQREIEDGHRKQIGLWLRRNAASPSDSVMLEALGYIGFFSQLKMLDSPGLCAPEVVAATKKLRSTSWVVLIPELQPDWLVLRPVEAGLLQDMAPRLLTDMYSAVEVFDVSDRVAAYRWLPGRGYLSYDEAFLLFKRNRLSGAAQAIGPARALEREGERPPKP